MLLSAGGAPVDPPPMARGLWLILAGWGAIALLLLPFAPVPFIDDWVYAWSVERLLSHGQLEVLDFSSNAIYAQALWGALFCLPFGFSFAALRVSTWVLSCVAIAGTYRLLREAGASEAGATLGAATLAAFPPFMVLSFSFMTDVPLVAVETWTLVFFARAWRNDSRRDLWIGTALACGAAAIRIVGLVPALGMGAALVVHRRGSNRWRALVPLTAVPLAAALAWYHANHVHHVADLRYIQNTPAPRLDALREHALPLLPAWLPLSFEFLAVGTGLALAPVAIGLVGFPGRWRRAALIGAGSLGLFLLGQWAGGLHYPAFASEGTWLSDELGSVVTLIPGWRPLAVAAWVRVTATLACWASFVVMAVGAIHGRPRTLTRPVFAWALAGLVLMTAVLWLATDRYILPFLSPALALVLGRGTAVSPRRGAIAVGVFALIGGVTLRDRDQAERAVWSAIGSLRQDGVPVSRIDAGYTANGWLQYAHPDQAHHDEAGHVAVPFVNGDASLPWVVSVAPMPDAELVSEYQFRRTGRSPRSVYVSKRRPGAAAAAGR
jgi:hypothetical protein